MDREQQAVNKLIILEILAQAGGITGNQLLDQALGTLCLDYFAFTRARDELLRDSLITIAVRKHEELTDAGGQPVQRCDITTAGRQVLTTLANHIPLPIRSYLATSLAALRRDELRENTVTASVEPDANGFYTLRLRQNDGRHETVDLKLTIPNQAIADTMRTNWLERPQTMYISLLELLTRSSAPADTGRQPEPESTNSNDNDFPDRQLSL
ncbi:MAG: DUF4364 family protein [Ruminococcaceae bacterium]|nr:DUF4364 family protein [Oscillospiraceae bacterium]